MLNARDWRGLIQYGASFFLLEKMGAVVGVSNLHIYAAMRGQTLEAFQQTRNQQVTGYLLVARLLKRLQRLPAHRGVNMQVGYADHRAHFLQQEEAGAILN